MLLVEGRGGRKARVSRAEGEHQEGDILKKKGADNTKYAIKKAAAKKKRPKVSDRYTPAWHPRTDTGRQIALSDAWGSRGAQSGPVTTHWDAAASRQKISSDRFWGAPVDRGKNNRPPRARFRTEPTPSGGKGQAINDQSQAGPETRARGRQRGAPRRNFFAQPHPPSPTQKKIALAAAAAPTASTPRQAGSGDKKNTTSSTALAMLPQSCDQGHQTGGNVRCCSSLSIVSGEREKSSRRKKKRKNKKK